jgi:hypothetical protein
VRLAACGRHAVESRLGAETGDIACSFAPEISLLALGDIDDVIADRHADPTLGLTPARENAEGQVLNRKIGIGRVG